MVEAPHRVPRLSWFGRMLWYGGQFHWRRLHNNTMGHPFILDMFVIAGLTVKRMVAVKGPAFTWNMELLVFAGGFVVMGIAVTVWIAGSAFFALSPTKADRCLQSPRDDKQDDQTENHDLTDDLYPSSWRRSTGWRLGWAVWLASGPVMMLPKEPEVRIGPQDEVSETTNPTDNDEPTSDYGMSIRDRKHRNSYDPVSDRTCQVHTPLMSIRNFSMSGLTIPRNHPSDPRQPVGAHGLSNHDLVDVTSKVTDDPSVGQFVNQCVQPEAAYQQTDGGQENLDNILPPPGYSLWLSLRIVLVVLAVEALMHSPFLLLVGKN